MEVNWNKVSKNVFREGDTNYDKKISSDELAEAIFYQYDIEGKEEGRRWIVDNINDYCGKYKEVESTQFNQTGLEQCITENGKGIFQGAKEWAEEEKREKEEPEKV